MGQKRRCFKYGEPSIKELIYSYFNDYFKEYNFTLYLSTSHSIEFENDHCSLRFEEVNYFVQLLMTSSKDVIEYNFEKVYQLVHGKEIEYGFQENDNHEKVKDKIIKKLHHILSTEFLSIVHGDFPWKENYIKNELNVN